jgi:hypothetical protein
MNRCLAAIVVALSSVSFVPFVPFVSFVAAEQTSDVREEVTRLLSAYVAINTANPPGNTREAVDS